MASDFELLRAFITVQVIGVKEELQKVDAFVREVQKRLAKIPAVRLNVPGVPGATGGSTQPGARKASSEATQETRYLTQSLRELKAEIRAQGGFRTESASQRGRRQALEILTGQRTSGEIAAERIGFATRAKLQRGDEQDAREARRETLRQRVFRERERRQREFLQGLAIGSRNTINNLSFLATQSFVAGAVIRAVGVQITSQIPVISAFGKAYAEAAENVRTIRKIFVNFGEDMQSWHTQLRILLFGVFSFFRKLIEIARPLLPIIGAVAAGIAGLVLGFKALQRFARLEQTETIFGVLTGSAGVTRQLLDELRALAARTTLTFDSVRAAAQSLLVALPADQIGETVRRLGDIAAGTGSDIRNLARNYAKAFQRGRVTQEVLELFQFQNVPIVQALAEELGTTQTGVAELVRQGQVNAIQLQRAINRLTDPGGRFFGGQERLANTILGLITTIRDNLNQTMENFGRIFATVSRELLTGIRELTNELLIISRDLAPILTSAMEPLGLVLRAMRMQPGFISQISRGPLAILQDIGEYFRGTPEAANQNIIDDVIGALGKRGSSVMDLLQYRTLLESAGMGEGIKLDTERNRILAEMNEKMSQRGGGGPGWREVIRDDGLHLAAAGGGALPFYLSFLF